MDEGDSCLFTSALWNAETKFSSRRPYFCGTRENFYQIVKNFEFITNKEKNRAGEQNYAFCGRIFGGSRGIDWQY